MMLKRSILVIVTLAATANASVWDRASTGPEDQAAQDRYDAKLLEGDTATLTATIQSTGLIGSRESIRRAEAAYRAAAAARPAEGEPYFRIGKLLDQMYYSCELVIPRPPTCNPNNMSRAEALIEAWEEFEARAPLDPRVNEILVRRALLHTRLVDGSAADRRHLEKAARDYQTALDRSDGLTPTRADELLLGNLAETYMMLDRLDDAIAGYLQVIAIGAARVSTVYGLAVALDRDGAGEQAIRRIQAQGPEGLETFARECLRRSVFFVPAGESAYYFALASEAFGNHGAALTLWNHYLASGAHPEYQPRAREHIEQLRRKRVHAEPPPPELDPPPC